MAWFHWIASISTFHGIYLFLSFILFICLLICGIAFF